MDEKKAKHLVMQLINAAYEAGIYSVKPDKSMKKHWQEKAMKIRDNIIYHLTRDKNGN
jgi:hypothetical protein